MGERVADSVIAIPQVSEQQVVQFCANCHRLPDPASFSLHDWREEVRQGYQLHMDSGRVDLIPPPREGVIAWYESRAPETTRCDPALSVVEQNRPSPIAFDREEIPAPAEQLPGVARLRQYVGRWEGIYACDVFSGTVQRFQSDLTKPTAVWKVPCAVSVTPLNLDPNGEPGLAIASLGTYVAEDHQLGSVWWVADEQAQPRLLISNLARVSDISAADLDGDGDDELIVSEFGWRRSGRLLVYWNDQPNGDWPHLQPTEVDLRHGALRAEAVDLDGDGKLEIIAAFGQEYETIDVYRLIGARKFEKTTIYQAPDPSYGTSDFTIADLDQDGLRDILVAHGDSMDGGDLRPHHGVVWLRQTTAGKFIARPLCAMHGTHQIVPADLDRDGDLDLVLVSMVPNAVLTGPDHPRLASVVWLEQQPDQSFIPHVLEWEDCLHTTCAVRDVDNDGDLDLIVGWLSRSAGAPERLTLFRNGLNVAPAQP